MKLASVLLLVSSILSEVFGELDTYDLSNQNGDVLISKLPSDVKSDFLKILTGSANAIGGSCLGIEPNYDKIELLLYSNDPNKHIKLDPKNPIGIDNNAPLFLLTHGWLARLNDTNIKAYRDKYIEVFGKNIIFVNWSSLSWYTYATVYCNVPLMAQYVATFLCTLSENYNYPLNKVHMVGHSFGAHFVGYTGKFVQKTCNKKIGRITGLDPAGAMYRLLSTEKRIAPTDAEFVEIVHTNAGIFGYLGKSGTVDYHINCGTIQPGCIIPEHISEIAETSISLVSCAHFRALKIWPYVLGSNEFKAKSCRHCPLMIPGTCLTDITGAKFVNMGHIYENFTHDHYNVITGPYPPYSTGCTAYPLQGCS